MGIHIAASKCPHVHAGVVESVPAALRAITGNGVNVLAMGAFYVAPQMGCDIADAYLNAELGTGYEWWKNFYEFHKLAIDEMVKCLDGVDCDVIAGTESRGFVFGMPIAYLLNKPFVMVRKAGKLPCETVSKTYDLEYGTATIVF